MDKSAVSNHYWNNFGHENQREIKWDEAKIIVSEDRFTQRTMIEAIMIKKALQDGTPLMNRKEEEGRDWLPDFWNPFFFDFYNLS